MKHYAEDIKEPLSPESVPVQKQRKYMPGITNGQVRESAAFVDQSRTVIYSPFILNWYMYLRLAKDVRFAINADDTHWATVNEKTSNCRTSFWQAMEVEKKPPSVASTI